MGHVLLITLYHHSSYWMGVCKHLTTMGAMAVMHRVLTLLLFIGWILFIGKLFYLFQEIAPDALRFVSICFLGY